MRASHLVDKMTYRYTKTMDMLLWVIRTGLEGHEAAAAAKKIAAVRPRVEGKNARARHDKAATWHANLTFTPCIASGFQNYGQHRVLLASFSRAARVCATPKGQGAARHAGPPQRAELLLRACFLDARAPLPAYDVLHLFERGVMRSLL
jgi:hypothetical protein